MKGSLPWWLPDNYSRTNPSEVVWWWVGQRLCSHGTIEKISTWFFRSVSFWSPDQHAWPWRPPTGNLQEWYSRSSFSQRNAWRFAAWTRFSLYDSVCALFYATPNSFARTQGSKGSKGSKTLSCINHGQAGQGHFRWSPWWSMWLQDTLAIVLSRFNDNQWTPFVVISGTEPGNALPSPSETSVDHTGPTHHHGWDLITLRVLVCIYIYIYMY